MTGLANIFIFQVIINISSSLNIIPTKGMTLPLYFLWRFIIHIKFNISRIHIITNKRGEKCEIKFFNSWRFRGHLFPAISLTETDKTLDYYFVIDDRIEKIIKKEN